MRRIIQAALLATIIGMTGCDNKSVNLGEVPKATTNESAKFVPPDTNGSFIVDSANKLSLTDLATLRQKIHQLNVGDHKQIAVLIIPSLNGQEISEVANLTFTKWKLGSKDKDDGVLLVLAIADRKSRLEIGRGAEGDITDAQSKDIQDNILRPQLKQGKFFEGINLTIDAVSAKVNRQYKETL